MWSDKRRYEPVDGSRAGRQTAELTRCRAVGLGEGGSEESCSASESINEALLTMSVGREQ